MIDTLPTLEGTPDVRQLPAVQMLPPPDRRHREHYSYSSLSTFDRCGFAFAKGYLTDGKPPADLPTAKQAADTGKAVHDTLEHAGAAIVRASYRGQLEPERLVALFRRKMQTDSLFGVEWALLGEDLLHEWAERIGTLQHVQLVEHRFDLLVEDRRLMGYVDRIDVLPDGTVYVVDYKTGKYRPTAKDLEGDLQLGIYAAVAWRLYPKATRVVVALDLLRHGYSVEREISRFEADGVVGYAYALIRRIEDDPDAFAPRLNTLCSWCDHRATCPAWKAALHAPLGTPAHDLTDLASVAAEYAHLTICDRLISKRKTELGKVLKEHLKQSDDPEDAIEAAGKRFRLLPTTSKTYPVKEALVKLTGAGVPFDAYQHLTLPQKTVSALLKKLGDGDEPQLTREQVALLTAELDAIAKTRRNTRLDVR